MNMAVGQRVGLRRGSGGRDRGVARATTTEVAATLPAAEATWPSWGMLSTKGSEPSHASGPVTGRRRPIETSRKARTTWGSNWVPAQAASSMRAAWGLTGRL